ncbi:MAG: hypothetical protein IT214_08655 [Chitinophagaceae bacterium]|jgi:hypothetical protein|nr:hypothetical protein [Chitinophagaceae bacterium]OQY95510.1 MAG: hypothetical protein B6D37_05815 [Sphingobacteriales bacterium UTBCD1]
MDPNTLALVIAVFAILISGISLILVNQKLKRTTKEISPFDTKPLQLQAYERLVMLTERIALPNLVSRVSKSGMGAKDMQLLLLESVKQEYEYNATQQIYVSPVAWEAVHNLKEQNLLIINKVASTLPEGATGLELNKRLLEFVLNNPKGTLHSIVLEALNYEAKKLMR